MGQKSIKFMGKSESSKEEPDATDAASGSLDLTKCLSENRNVEDLLTFHLQREKKQGDLSIPPL